MFEPSAGVWASAIATFAAAMVSLSLARRQIKR
jgi:hypothetical protein